MVWSDSTSYSQSQKERVQNSWTYKNAVLQITVTKGHIYHKGEWVMHCFQIRMDTVPMKLAADASPEQAQELAVKMVRKRLDIFSSSLA